MRKENTINDFCHIYKYSSTLPFWEHIFHNKDFDGYVFFCTKNKRSIQTLHFCKASDISTFLSDLKVFKDHDYYYTINHFRNTKKGVNRDTNHVFAYTGVVIDIDCHNSKIKPKIFQQYMYEYLQKVDCMQQLESHIPYNIVVYTQRGLQFIYVYEKPLSYKVDFIHKRIVDILLKQHETILNDNPHLPFSLDSATTKRACGLYRMPFTYNSKCPTKFISYTITKARYLDPDKIIDTYGLVNAPIPTYTIKKEFQPNNTHASIRRCQKVINAIYAYQESGIASQKNPGHENRTCSCFMLSPFLLAIMPYSNALEELKSFNTRFNNPLSERRIKEILDYCMTNYENDEKCSMRYFKNETILRYLDIPSGSYGIYATDDFVYNPYYSQISLEERKEKKQQKVKRNTMILEQVKKGVPYPTIIKEMKISRATLYRLIKKSKE